MVSILSSGSVKKVKFLLYLLFLIAIVGSGSADQPVRTGFEITEQVCQGGFLIFLILEACAFGVGNKFFRAVDLLSVVSSFAGIHTQGSEISRYLLALRVLRVRLLLREILSLDGEMMKLGKSLKTAANVLLPIFFMILLYSVVGMHCFGGSHRPIQVSSSAGAETLSTSSKRATGQCTREKSSYAGRNPVQWSMGFSTNA